MSANLFVRAVDSAVLSTIGSYASIRGNDFPDASSLIVFASSTAFVMPLRKASMHVGAAFSLPSHFRVLLLFTFFCYCGGCGSMRVRLCVSALVVALTCFLHALSCIERVYAVYAVLLLLLLPLS